MRIRNGFEELFCLCSNLSNDNIISALRPGLKTGIYFAHFGLESVWFFGRTTRVYERYLSFQFQMNNKEREICEFEMDLKNFLVCTLI